MERNQLRQHIALSLCGGIGPSAYFAITDHFSNLDELFKATSNSLEKCGLNSKQIKSIKNPNWHKVDETLTWEEQTQNHILVFGDNNYPNLLKEISDPPPILFASGDINCIETPQLAIIGSRTATPAGLKNANHFAKFLSQHGMTITSGLALGIDSASHQGALQGSGKTIAVLGTGLDKIYPSRNKNLAYEIFDKGLLVSEFPLGTSPHPGHFPKRNRIISGMSLGTLVIEATEKSGSLITANLALEQGREVFAIPGSIHNPHAKGCHKLIKNGAKLVDKAQDVIQELESLLGFISNLENSFSDPINDTHKLDPEYQILLQHMGYEAMSIDEIVYRSGLTIDKVSSMLLILELNDQINTAPGGLYIRTS